MRPRGESASEDEGIPSPDFSFLEKHREATRSEPGLYSLARQGSCYITVSRTRPSLGKIPMLATWSSADRRKTLRLAAVNGRPVVDIYDGRSKLYVQMEFSSLGALLSALCGGSPEFLSIAVSHSLPLEQPTPSDWTELSSWLRSILPSHFEYHLTK
jgi:hypothetical protein